MERDCWRWLADDFAHTGDRERARAARELAAQAESGGAPAGEQRGEAGRGG